MNSAKAVFLGWLLCTTSLIVISETGAQVSLKEKLCNGTGTGFLVCMRCLNGPSKQEAESHEAAQIGAKTIKCAFDSTASVRELMVPFSKNSSEPIHDAATSCLVELKTAALSFSAALDYWTYKKKDYTLASIRDAVRDFNACASSLPSEKPPVISDGIDVIRDRASVTYAVIKEIQV